MCIFVVNFKIKVMKKEFIKRVIGFSAGSTVVILAYLWSRSFDVGREEVAFIVVWLGLGLLYIIVRD